MKKVFDKKYLGHDFQTINSPIDYANDYICKKCNVRIVCNFKNKSEYYREVTDNTMGLPLTLTCKECIIKNIIE